MRDVVAPYEQLHRLIYSSFACPGLTLSEITAFLQTAENRNRACDIYGALVFANGTFLQMLEGRRDVVSETFGRIQRDNRHRQVCLIDFSICENRRFSGWAMRHLGFSNDWLEGDFTPSRWSAEQCLRFFERYNSEVQSRVGG